MRIKDSGGECVIQSTRRRRLARIDSALATGDYIVEDFKVGDPVRRRWVHPEFECAEFPPTDTGIVLEIMSETHPPKLTVLWAQSGIDHDWADDLERVS